MNPRASTQRRRRGIFVESRCAQFPSSIGATYSDAAPTGLGGFMGFRGYKDVASTVLTEQRRIAAELAAFYLPRSLTRL